MSDQELDLGDAKESDAAAMDALNLDDLFLGGGDNDEEPLADSLFADMDIDLGDIMDGIIGESGGNMSALVSEEFGGGGGVVAAQDESSSPDLDPMSMMDAATTIDAAPSNDYSSSSVTGSKGSKTKSRTARSNPFLAMAQQEQKEKEKESRLAKQLGISGSDHILSSTVKRKRRKSKKFSSDDDIDHILNNDSAGMAAAEAYAAAKKSGRRRVSDGNRGIHRAKISNTLDSSIHSNSSIQSTQGIQSNQGATSSNQMSVEGEANIAQQDQLPRQVPQLELQSNQFQHPEKKDDSEQHEREAKKKYERQQLLLKQEQEAISKFGIDPSPTLFFPFMQLPAEVDVKKRGHKAYPCLEKLNAYSDVRAQPSQSEPLEQQQNDNQNGNNAAISVTSPLYELFDTNLGALTDNQGNKHLPESLQSSLLKSTQHATSLVQGNGILGSDPGAKEGKKHGNKPSPLLIDELSKLYTGCMKQSAFLRQNMWNMERWCSDHLEKDDVKSTFEVRRRDIEWVLRMMQQMKQRRLEQQRQQKIRAKQLLEQQKLQKIQQQQQLQLQQKQREQQLQKQKLKLKKILAPDKNCLPFPETLPGAPTHGGLNNTPVIAIKVKVKLSGWRDKSGIKLNARLWSPAGWKVAMKRSTAAAAAAAAASAAVEINLGGAADTLDKIGKSSATAVEGETSSGTSTVVAATPLISNKDSQIAAAAAIAAAGVTAPALDVSSVVSKATLEAVAWELVRPDLMPKSSSSSPPKSTSPVAKTTSSTTTSPTTNTITKSSAPAMITSGGGVIPEEKKGEKKEEKKKTTTRKRKAKEGGSGASSSGADVSSAASSSSKSTAFGSHRSYKRQQLIPHVPSYDRPHKLHRLAAFLDTTSAGVSGNRTATTIKYISTAIGNNYNDANNDPQQQRSRLLQFLYSQILQPSSSPTERRALLADEISSTLARLEHAHRLRQSPKVRNIKKQLEGLHSVYREDIENDTETIPKHGNTKGLWNWIKGNNYFDEFDTSEDVHDGLKDCWQPELDERQSCLEEEDDREYWGSLFASPPLDKKKVVVEEDENIASESSSAQEESSPLFDRLQSLLVEVDEGESDDDDEDEDYLISNLPEFSPEEFIHGPKKNNSSLDCADHPDDAMIDVSALTIDQRTYVQLRAVGLISDDNTPPPLLTPKTSIKTNTSISHVKNNESIDAVLSNMKSYLSTLHVETNTDMASLQRRALAHVVCAPGRRRRDGDDEVILKRYEQLKNMQRERREEEENQRQITIRTSGRVKTGSNKFDGEQWLPW